MRKVFGSIVVAIAGLLLGAGAAHAQPGPGMPSIGPLDEATIEQGNGIYRANCAACHENAGSHAPGRQAISTLTPEVVLRALTDGRMKNEAASLSEEERAAVAQAITGLRFGAAPPPTPVLMCEPGTSPFDFSRPPAFSGWGLDAANSHSVSSDLAGLSAEDLPNLTLRWAFAIPGALETRAQPAIAAGAIFVGGTNGKLYALDMETGCARWEYEAQSGIRSGVTISPWDAGNAEARPLLYFGDNVGNTYAVDAVTGEEAWARHVDAHPATTLTGPATLSGDTLFVPISSGEEGSAAIPGYECCTFRGSLLALDAHTGGELWRTYMVDEPQPVGENESGTLQRGPSGVPIWSAPLADTERGLVYVATGNNYSHPSSPLSGAIVALDMQTGAIRWATQVTQDDVWNVACWGGADGPNCPNDAGPDYDFGAGPVLATGNDGKTYLLAGQKSGIAYGFHPDSGELLWQTQVGRGGELGGVHFGIAAEGGRAYIPVNDAENGADYGEPGKPGIYALDVATGDLLWSHAAEDVCEGKDLCQPGYSSAITVTPELVLAGNTDAHFRILSAATGEVLWDVDTDRAYESVNGTLGHGGSMSGHAAPILQDGMLLISSGYAFLGKISGNMLLVYGVD